jgi:DUF971 family protein
MSPEPLEIEVENGTKSLRIAWDDQVTSRYPLRYLRGYCPCAHCQGHGGPLRFVAVAAPAITRIDEVGSYAVNIVWRDGEGTPLHSTGIYSFDYLRDLDPEAGKFPRQDLD